MFWRKRVVALAEEYPDVELSHMYVDNAAMQLVRYPKQVRLWNKLTTPVFDFIFGYAKLYSHKKIVRRMKMQVLQYLNTEFCSLTLL
jgi:hypothetical protein